MLEKHACDRIFDGLISRPAEIPSASLPSLMKALNLTCSGEAAEWYNASNPGVQISIFYTVGAKDHIVANMEKRNHYSQLPVTLSAYI